MYGQTAGSFGSLYVYETSKHLVENTEGWVPKYGKDQAWTTFKDRFNEKYVPSHIKRQKTVGFQLLKQGDMTCQTPT